jgi:hypothetical protein
MISPGSTFGCKIVKKSKKNNIRDNTGSEVIPSETLLVVLMW